MNLDIPVLEGVRIRLLPLDPSHIEPLYAAASFPEIWTYLPCRMQAREDMVQFVEEALEDKAQGTEVPFAVYDKILGKLVGSTRFLNISVPNRHLEIGFTWYTPEVWRTRVNTECKFLLLQAGFEQLHTVRIQLKADVRNERSNQAIRRIGAVHEGILRQDRILPDGHVRNAHLYSILDSEWPRVKEHLEQKLQLSPA